MPFIGIQSTFSPNGLPGDVLFLTKSGLGHDGAREFNDFVVICFQAARYQDAFYFVPKRMSEDAEKALSIFGKLEPNFYAYLIPIEDDDKFKNLLAKSSAGYALKGDGDWKKMHTQDFI